MMISPDGMHFFGHAVEIDPERPKRTPRSWERYRYVDTKEPVDFKKPRPCKLCGLERTAEGHDPCIANLPGVKSACCGHGVSDSHVVLNDGRVLRGLWDHAPKAGKEDL